MEAKPIKPKYIILVAKDFKNFEHYCLKPQIYYNSEDEAKAEMRLKIRRKEFKETQIKVEKLWLVLPSKTEQQKLNTNL